MNTYTQRPFTPEERTEVERILGHVQPVREVAPVLKAACWVLCVGSCSVLFWLILAGLFGKTSLILAIAAIAGSLVGDGISRAWNAVNQKVREAQAEYWSGLQESWQQVLDEGMMEVLSTPVTEYVVVGLEDGGEEECVYFIPVGESSTLCLFQAELESPVVDQFPGSQLEVTRYPATAQIHDIQCSGQARAPLCFLNWSDFAGFSSAESFYGWLVHGKVYPLSLDRLGEELISAE